MQEKWVNEQYFFDESTVTHMANFVQVYPNPCCLCAPRLGHELERREIVVRTLDIDERFDALRGFRRYDLTKPEWLGEAFGIIVSDPPFFNAVPVSALFDTVRVLSRYSVDQKLLVSWPVRRSKVLLNAFSAYDLAPSGFRPGYSSVPNEGTNLIEFYGNLGEEEYRRLAHT